MRTFFWVQVVFGVMFAGLGACAPDATPAARGGALAGTPCELDDDCPSGYCVGTLQGSICVDVCIESCEPGFTCSLLQNNSPDITYVCVPSGPASDEDASDGEVADDITVSDDAAADATELDTADAPSEPDASVDEDTSVAPDTTASDIADTTPEPDAGTEDTGAADTSTPDGHGTCGCDQHCDDVHTACADVWIDVDSMCVRGVEVWLNGELAVGDDDFHWHHGVHLPVDLVDGTNTIEVVGAMHGSQGDFIKVTIVDSDGVVYYSRRIESLPVPPERFSDTFAVERDCE